MQGFSNFLGLFQVIMANPDFQQKIATIFYIWIRKTSHDIEVIQSSVGGACECTFLGIRYQLQAPITSSVQDSSDDSKCF